MFERGEKLRRRALPVALALVLAGGAAERTGIISLGFDSRASGNAPAQTAGSFTVESTMYGIEGGEGVDVTCSGFDSSRVAQLAQGEGFSAVVGQVTRGEGVADGAIADAIEGANGIDSGPQPDVPYTIPTRCSVDS